jgi:uncharacterized protein (TIGR03435 family)
MKAFGVELFRVESPMWVWEQLVEIHAILPAGATHDQVPEMLRTLLAERFGLVTRMESRVTDVYALVVGKDGLKMREVDAIDDLEKPIVDPSGRPAVVDSRSADDQTRVIMFDTRHTRIVTARTMFDAKDTERGTRQIDATRMSISELVDYYLRGVVDRPVIDETGLTGLYQFRIELPPNNVAARYRPPNATQPSDPSGVSAFRAVESLGLKLESRRVPIDFLVVERLNRAPTPD